MTAEILGTNATALFLLIGSGFVIVGVIGLLKFNDPMTRLHAPTKVGTIGIGNAALAPSILKPLIDEWLAPLVIGLILGPMAEENLRRALIDSGGSLLPFVTRPLSLGFLILTTLVLALQWWKRRTNRLAHFGNASEVTLNKA